MIMKLPVYANLTQMICPELGLEAVLCPGQGRRHDSGVVEQDVQPVQLGPELVGARSHASQAGQVELAENNLTTVGTCGFAGYFFGGRQTLFTAATEDDDLGTAAAQLGGAHPANAGVGACDDGHLAGQLGLTHASANMYLQYQIVRIEQENSRAKWSEAAWKHYSKHNNLRI